MKIPGVRETLIGTLVMAAASSFADAFWAAALPEHRTVYGLVHGAIVLAVMGLTLAKLSGTGRVALGAAAGLMIGLGAAAAFYVLYPLIDVAAMLVAWMGMWVAFAALNNSLSAAPETTSRAVTRGVVAAVLAGVSFWAISGIWLGAHDPGPLYVRNFAYWCVAFLPGFGALLLFRRGH